MASSLDERMGNAENEDDYTYIEYDYYDEEMTEEKKIDYDQDGKQLEQDNKRLKNSTGSVISAVTVEGDETDKDDEDEYTYEYEEETILESVMESDYKKRYMNQNIYIDDSTAVPPPLPAYRATTTGDENTASAISTPKEASTLTSTFTLTIPRKAPPAVQASISPITRCVNDPVVTPRSKNVIKEEDDASVHLSASKKRASAANSVGLSELSKQLRILQAKNESQAVDNHRLERQLRILADLQGISVGELRRALEDACASEAFGELQNRVSKLKYELEAATLAKQAELRKDATAPHIANLELRVGELEEVEEKQAKEIRTLYEDLRQERAKSMRLESENQPLKKALQDMIQRCQSETARAAQLEADLRKEIQGLRELQSKKMRKEAERSRDTMHGVGKSAGTTRGGDGVAAAGNSSSSSVMTVPLEMATDYEEMVQLLKKRDAELRDVQAKLHADETQRAEKLNDAEERARQIHMDMRVEKDKLALTVKELEDADGQNGLRLAQYKARFAVQDERIVDMGQQLDSLYVAFTLLKEEYDSENEKHAAMMTNLNDADAEIARQTNEMEIEQEKKKGRPQRERGVWPPGPSPSTARSTSTASVNSTTHSGSNTSTEEVAPQSATTSAYVGDHRHSIVATAPVATAPISPGTPDPTRQCHSMHDAPYAIDAPITYATARAFHPSPERTPSTWQLLFPNGQDQSGTGDRYEGVNNASNDGRHRGRHQHQQDQYQHHHELISGPLIEESNSMLRKWKNKPKASKIYFRGQGYQWEVNPKRSFPLEFGISKVEYNPNHPLSFAVYLDPSTKGAPVIRAAALNERDYHRWMAALYKATTGEEYQGAPEIPIITSPSYTPSSVSSPRLQSMQRSTHSNARRPHDRRFSHLSSPRPSSNRSIQSLQGEGQEDFDLQRALALSRLET
uniref:PH domain-containing protein n=1 Tax=Pseudo-nitzschia australis TaxID=44445 RepID=A0A7S4ACP3_9STRA|mmetsp:Transcript_3262/g.7044  ORF Transcript_3262/g.7044 Transcript_3262/m.7044 type:complete len:917 (+) Transcript_3262:93-2843(+)